MIDIDKECHHPAFFTATQTRGKLRVLLVDGIDEKPLAVEVVNIVDLMCKCLDSQINIAREKPEREPFSWFRFMLIADTVNDPITVLERWGNVTVNEWTKTIRPGSDRLHSSIKGAHIALEHHNTYCEKLGNIGYIKIIVKEVKHAETAINPLVV